jgi:hypothetical protein
VISLWYTASEVNICFATARCPNRITFKGNTSATYVQINNKDFKHMCPVMRKLVQSTPEGLHRRATHSSLSLGKRPSGRYFIFCSGGREEFSGETISKIYHWSWSLPSSKQNTSLPAQQERTTVSDSTSKHTSVDFTEVTL